MTPAPGGRSQYDLHCHSTRSDGLLSPAEVVARAASRGVRVLALTDHDELSGLAEAREAAEAFGVRLVDAVEVSVTWNTHTLHVVGLGVDASSRALVEGLARTRSGRDERAQRIAAELSAVGIEGALCGARRYVTNPELVSRTHFARFLVDSGHAASTHAVFDRYLAAGKPGYVDHRWASLADAVRWIVDAGGLAVLAHPGRYKLTEVERAGLLGEFRDRGGVSIEVVTGSHAPEEYDYWARRAREFGLLSSLGSDFHAPRESYRDLGDLPPLPASCVPVWTQL